MTTTSQRLHTWPQQGKERENQKYGAHAPQLHPIWPQAAPGAMRQHLFPLSIFDGEGARGSYKYRFFTLGRGPVPALGVFVVFDAPFPFAISSCSELKVWAVSGAR